MTEGCNSRASVCECVRVHVVVSAYVSALSDAWHDSTWYEYESCMHWLVHVCECEMRPINGKQCITSRTYVSTVYWCNLLIDERITVVPSCEAVYADAKDDEIRKSSN